MGGNTEVTQDEVKRLYEKLRDEAESAGYHLNPDTAMTRDLVNGLLVNEKRNGYLSLPAGLRRKGGRPGHRLPVRLPRPRPG